MIKVLCLDHPAYQALCGPKGAGDRRSPTYAASRAVGEGGPRIWPPPPVGEVCRALMAHAGSPAMVCLDSAGLHVKLPVAALRRGGVSFEAAQCRPEGGTDDAIP